MFDLVVLVHLRMLDLFILALLFILRYFSDAVNVPDQNVALLGASRRCPSVAAA